MLDKPASALRIRERLIESERLMEETGCYDGITELELRQQDPLKFEALHTKLRAFCVSAREMARRISASPGVREVGEMVVAIYTPEGDAIALSNGIMQEGAVLRCRLDRYHGDHSDDVSHPRGAGLSARDAIGAQLGVQRLEFQRILVAQLQFGDAVIAAGLFHELPFVRGRLARPSPADAAVGEQVARVSRRAASCEIVG